MKILATCVALITAAGCADVVEHHDVAYDPRGGEATVLDLYEPADGMAARPAVLFIHGGGWRMGSKEHFSRLALRLARSGFVTATINYHLVPEGAYPVAIQDCFCALSWLRAHAAEYGIDPERIAVMGYSAGAHLTSIVGVGADVPEFQAGGCPTGRTGPPAAVIPADGPHDLRGIDHSWVSDFLGGSEDEVPERYVAASPITHVRPGLPRFLLIQADGDLLVNPDQARAMRDALTGAGDDVSYLELAGGGHLLNEGVDQASEYGEVSSDQPEATLALFDFLGDL